MTMIIFYNLGEVHVFRLSALIGYIGMAHPNLRHDSEN